MYFAIIGWYNVKLRKFSVFSLCQACIHGIFASDGDVMAEGLGFGFLCELIPLVRD